VKIGVVYPQIELQGRPSAIGRFALAAEKLGYQHLSVYDHVVGAAHEGRTPPLTGPYTERDPFDDPLMMFAHLSGITRRLEFCTSIMILPQRQTVLLARQAADLDLLSNERLRLGVGTGWNYVEYDALNEDFATRGLRLDEQIDALRQLWNGPLTTFHGRFHNIQSVALNPLPKRQIPIWLGGFAEPAYRRAGRTGDGFIFANGLSASKAGWESVRQHLEDAGRDLASFGRDFITGPVDKGRVRDSILQWRDLGGTHGTVGTIGRGFTEVEAHIDFISEVRELLGSEMPATP